MSTLARTAALVIASLLALGAYGPRAARAAGGARIVRREDATLKERGSEGRRPYRVEVEMVSGDGKTRRIQGGKIFLGGRANGGRPVVLDPQTHTFAELRGDALRGPARLQLQLGGDPSDAPAAPDPSARRPDVASAPPGAATETRLLGARRVNGADARGTLQSRAATVDGAKWTLEVETWEDRYGRTVRQERRDSLGGSGVTDYFYVDGVDLPDALFEIPDDYRLGNPIALYFSAAPRQLLEWLGTAAAIGEVCAQRAAALAESPREWGSGSLEIARWARSAAARAPALLESFGAARTRLLDFPDLANLPCDAEVAEVFDGALGFARDVPPERVATQLAGYAEAPE